MSAEQIERIARFAAVGVLGFIVDAGMVVLLVQWLGFAPLPGRVMSFITAATVTYLLNKRFTFRMAERFAIDRWLLYLVTTAIGAAINVGIYAWWIGRHGDAALHLVLGTAMGSLVAMCVNFVISSRVVFKRSDLSAARR